MNISLESISKQYDGTRSGGRNRLEKENNRFA